MNTRSPRRVLWLAVLAILMFIGLARATSAAAAQGKPTAQQTTAGPAAAASYALCGDCTNTTGSFSTYFNTTTANTDGFLFTAASASYALLGIGGLTGVYGQGSDYG